MEEINMEGLSRKERKLQKKKLRKEEERKAMLKRKRKRTIMKAGIAAVVLVFIGYFFLYSSSPAAAPEGSPLMKITPTRYDFGSVSVGKGVVSTAMDILNEGEGNLVINQLESSCMCTTATIIKDGAEGPVFGMHRNPSAFGWSQTIGPNETAQLKIYYDPTVHRELRGPVTRIITIHSNDPVNPQKEIRIDVRQVA